MKYGHLTPALSPLQRNAEREIRSLDWNTAVALINRFACEPPSQRVSDWVAAHIIFNEPEVKGPFDFAGRCYLRALLDDNNDTSVSEQTSVFATGMGKTIAYLAGIGYKIVHKQPRVLWVMPATNGANGVRNFNRTRLIPMCRATATIADKMPTGADRFDVSGLHIRMAGSVIDFAGANSPGQLTGNRCGDIRLDEIDKFKSALGQEAGAGALAKTRADGVIGAQIFNASTPTVETGPVWQSLLASNLQRRFIPCPHCNKKLDHPDRFFVIIWSEQFCVLPNKFPDGRAIPAAQIRWDKEARRKDGEWDMDRVISSARAECPFCAGHIVDSDMAWCDLHGVWRATRPDRAANRHMGYHLPAMYAPRRGFDSTFGGMARKFLESQDSPDGMRGFINSVLAEVDASQEHGSNKVELSSRPLAQPDWIPLLTADYHKNHPYLWFIVRKWCAFKLLPPMTITDGRPEFITDLDLPENAAVRAVCARLIGRPDSPALTRTASPVWNVIGELARFNSNNPATGHSPLIDFLLAQNITGEKLVKFFKETAGADTMEFRRRILLAMFKLAGGDEKQFRAARGGDNELVAAGYCDQSGEYAWDELAGIIKEFKIGAGLKIPARAVGIDCGFAENKSRIVLQKCHESATEFDYYDPTAKTKEPYFTDLRTGYRLVHGWNGWQALRGKPTFQSQGGGLGRDLGKHVEDPYFGTPQGGTAVVDILEIPTALFWLRKDDIRQKRTRQIATVSPQVSFFPKRYLPDGTRTEESSYKLEDYRRQSSMMIYDETKGVIRSRAGTGGTQSRRHPDHPDDCETYQVALASHLEFFEESSSK